MSVFNSLTDAQCAKYQSPRKRKTKGADGKAMAKALALPDADPNESLPVEGGAVVHVPEEALQIEPTQCRDPGLKHIVVHYDRWTHSSGNLRAFTACSHHNACRRYTFVKNHDGGREEAEAWLMAWHASGRRLASAGVHKAHNPSDAEVRKFLRIQSMLA